MCSSINSESTSCLRWSRDSRASTSFSSLLSLRALPAPSKAPGAVLKERPLPLIKLAGVDLVLLAQLRYRFAFQQMQPEDLHFLFATEVSPFILTHITVPFYGHQCLSSNPQTGLFS